MKRWNRAVMLCLGMQGLVWSGCAGVEEDSTKAPPPAVEGAEGADLGNAALLVSPEMFDLAARWSDESLGAGQVSALSEKTEDDAAATTLVDYARRHAPGLVAEATAMTPPAATNGTRYAQGNGCICQVLATFDVPTSSFYVPDSDGHWSLSFSGAAHTGEFHNAKSGGSTETRSDLGTMSTQFRTRMNCKTPAGAACSGSCTGLLYTDVMYSTLLTAAADTGGIWNKGATGQVADGTVLDWIPPVGMATRLFDKGASANHWASNHAWDPQAVANVVKGILGVARAIVDADLGGIGDGLVDSTVKGLFALRNHGGADGSTSLGLIAGYESLGAPFSVSYASNVNQYSSLKLTTSVSMRARGYGGWHRASGNLASSYGLAAYVDNFSCDANVATPPARGAFWRYDGYGGAYVSVDSLRQRVGNFFYLAFGVRPDVSQNQGSLAQGVCGDGICGGLETDATCAVDCVRCGDSVCSPGENVYACPGDCGYCGDYFCSSIENVYSCARDCATCGDGVCSSGQESPYSCSQDCSGYCGDGYCTSSEVDWCTDDCGNTLPTCFKQSCPPLPPEP